MSGIDTRFVPMQCLYASSQSTEPLALNGLASLRLDDPGRRGAVLTLQRS
jgi:hypothetical protein